MNVLTLQTRSSLQFVLGGLTAIFNHEDFIGLYEVGNISADCLVST